MKKTIIALYVSLLASALPAAHKETPPCVTKKQAVLSQQLFKAVRQGNDKQVREILLHDDSVANIQDIYGETALTIAAHSGNKEIMQSFIIHGINLNAPDSFYNTPLMIASAENDISMVKMLIEAGAQTDLLNIYHETAFDIAQKHTADESILDLLRNK